MIRGRILACALVVALPLPGSAFEALPGWVVQPTLHDYATLVARTEAAIEASPLALVTQASATVGARAIGEDIPGNMVLGVFAPPYAVRMLSASVQAGIEAPLRLYVTESEDGTATLSWRTASHVFAPYADGGDDLRALAAELDAILEELGRSAVE